MKPEDTDDVDEASPFSISEPDGQDGTLKSNTKDEDKQSFLRKLSADPVYRRNYFLTLNLISSFFALGWCFGQAGPSFLDIQHITNVDLDQGSYYFTASTIGYLVGSMSAGIVLDKIQNKVTLIFLSTVGIGITTAIIPWISIFGLMLFIQLLKGIAGGVIDTSGTALLSRTWGKNGRMFMQALHFGHAFGGALSPLAIAPFLIPESKSNSNLTVGSPKQSISRSISSDSILNETFIPTIYSRNISYTDTADRESILYVGFSISAAVVFICSFPMFISLIQVQNAIKQEKRVKSTKDKKDSGDQRKECRTRKMRLLIILILLSVFVVDCAIEDTFTAFLSTFCVRQLKWTKVKGALITSAFWAAYSAGRFAGIFLIVIFSPRSLIFFHSTLELISLCGLLTSALFNFHVGIWICAPISGFAMSIIFPSMFTWTEESFLPVTGFIASLFLVGATAGSSINPLILGQIMEKFSDMWYIYLLTGQSLLFYTIIICLCILSRILGKTNKECQDTEIEVRL